MNEKVYKELNDLIHFEILQRREEGCDVEEADKRYQQASNKNERLSQEELDTILQDLENIKPEKSFPYTEPSTLDDIRAERPNGPRRMKQDFTEQQLFNHIYGAWLGRAAGCTLGKPVEGWPKAQIDNYLQFAEALPLNDYIPLVDGHPDRTKLRFPESTRGNIHYMARDDDIDYTILGLHVLESYGLDFTTDNIAETWLNRLPYHLVFTAERAAYRNLVNNQWPPVSATYRNPYREWIGAQIRGDMWGYVAPGWPEKAAEYAFRDAAVSHVKNGIYGEMFVAAMLAASFVTSDVEEIIRIGLSEIPQNCRLAEAVRNTVEWSKKLTDWEEIWDKINKNYGQYWRVHTINNAALVVMALMVGQGDYETGIVVAVRGGWDTDCNGATAGSIFGLMLGAEALPKKWTSVLNDRLISAVHGFSECKISDLAKRSHEIAKKHIALTA